MASPYSRGTLEASLPRIRFWGNWLIYFVLKHFILFHLITSISLLCMHCLQIAIPTATSGRVCGSPIKTPQLPYSPSLLSSPVVIAVHEVIFFQCLKPIISHLHLLWELVLTNEPVVVMAPVPDFSANTVNALVQYVWPLKYLYLFAIGYHSNNFQNDISAPLCCWFSPIFYYSWHRLQGIHDEVS